MEILKDQLKTAVTVEMPAEAKVAVKAQASSRFSSYVKAL